ncbi:MAG: erythronate-4-phosphate dehydrogenase, partial [Muribaculaceae bacterium]|nr:erythronate-4-phosphate dehydrogenase [Muribaculaceae bacterium]
MNIVIESHVPYIAGVLEPWANVTYAPIITHDVAMDADVLIARTRTRCDARLLNATPVKWIGTATIGTDHIDLDYCQTHGIEVVNAPGCNAPAVAQWVMASIGQWMRYKGEAMQQGLTIGVVGVGHVGSIVARWARQLGFNVLECDPPRARREGGEFVDINTIARDSDIITFHTPLNMTGEDCTLHLCDSELLAQTNAKLIINAARGAVCDNGALLSWHGDVALDCWENEPKISRELLDKAFVATPHIAGYSLQ